jgi:hypothetical protein
MGKIQCCKIIFRNVSRRLPLRERTTPTWSSMREHFSLVRMMRMCE